MQTKGQNIGYIYAFLTITLWSGWAIVTRLGAVTSLSVFDIAALRFTSAGLMMLPIAIKHRKLIHRKNFMQIVAMTFGAGIGYFTVMGIGFKLAPAGHSIITPCLLTVLVALGSYFMFYEKFSKPRLIGYALIITGVIYKMAFLSNGEYIADLFFIGGAFCWTIYTLLTKKNSHIPPLAVAAFVQVGSGLLVIIPYIIYQMQAPHTLPLQSSIIQVIYQGFFTSILSLLFFNKAMSYIGASRTSSFAALLPVMVTLGAMPILGEYPTVYDIIFVAFMSTGVFFASGVTAKLNKKPKKSLQPMP